MKKGTVLLIIIFCRVLTGEAQQAAGYYPFTGNANDLSGRNNHASSTGGAVLTADQNAKPNAAYLFNGSNVITVPNSTSLVFNNNMSVAALVKPAALPPAAGSQQVFTIAAKTAGAGNNKRKWIFGLQNGRMALHINAPGYNAGHWVYSNAFPLSLTTFYHCAFTKSGREVTFYLNGNATGSAILPADLLDPQAPLTLGYSEGSMYLNGVLDEVRLYDAVLDQPDITALPVKISSFWCNQSTKYPTLYWSTSVQENVNRYEIEKSIDARNFFSIGARPALQNVFSYHLGDSQAVQSKFIYYRIKVYDNDGRKSLSRVIRITPEAGSGVQVRTDAESKGSFLLTNDGAEKQLTLLVVHSSGARIMQRQLTVPSGAVVHQPIRGAAGSYFVYAFDAAGNRLAGEQVLIR